MNESQAVTYKTLIKDASYGETGPDERTIAAYLDLFNRLKLTEDLCGWEPPMRSKARVRVRPKRYFCDPSLARVPFHLRRCRQQCPLFPR